MAHRSEARLRRFPARRPIPSLNLRACLDKNAHTFLEPVRGREVQCREALTVDAINQPRHRRHGPHHPTPCIPRSIAHPLLSGVALALTQSHGFRQHKLHDSLVPPLGREMQHRLARFVRRVQLGAFREQESHDGGVAMLRGDVERRAARRGRGSGAGGDQGVRGRD